MMRRQRLFALVALLVLVLVGCQPAVTNTLNSKFGHPGVELVMSVDTSGYVLVDIHHPDVTLVDPALAIRGDNIAYNNDACVPVDGGIDCQLGAQQTIDGKSRLVLSGDKADYKMLLRGQDVMSNLTFYVETDGSVSPHLYLEQFITK